jgi:hypothetical protein
MFLQTHLTFENPSNDTKRTIDTKLRPKAIGIPEKRTIKVKTATIIAIINGSIN